MVVQGKHIGRDIEEGRTLVCRWIGEGNQLKLYDHLKGNVSTPMLSITSMSLPEIFIKRKNFIYVLYFFFCPYLFFLFFSVLILDVKD